MWPVVGVDKRQTGPLLSCANASRTHKTRPCLRVMRSARPNVTDAAAALRVFGAHGRLWGLQVGVRVEVSVLQCGRHTPATYFEKLPGTSPAGGSSWSKGAGTPPSHSSSGPIRPSASCNCCGERVANVVFSCPFLSRPLPCSPAGDPQRQLPRNLTSRRERGLQHAKRDTRARDTAVRCSEHRRRWRRRRVNAQRCRPCCCCSRETEEGGV